MKSSRVFFALLLLALFAAACGPTPTPAALAPEKSGDATWDRIQSTGKIVVGTSADYKPFEYYNTSNALDGFDIAIARDLGTRLGLQVELKDYAFEGLPAALQTGDVDVAIAAISVTSEREAKVDFSDVYYSEQDAVLARQGSGYPKITTSQQLTTYRVGVQRGTTYAAWLKKTLVDPGLMPATNMLEYAKPDDAVRDLKENRNDLVLLGLTPAKDYVTAGGVEMAGQSLNSQIYAIAMLKGSSLVKENLNKALTSMRNDGTLAKYSDYYLHVDYSQQPPVVATPVPAPTAAPAAPGAPVACYDSMQYIADVNVPDWTVMQPGQQFNKTWRIKNNGTCAWDSTYRLVYVQGSAMNGAPAAIQGVVNPGSQYDVTVGFTAPTEPGDYQSWWQMVNGQNIAFGIRIWVAITVPGASEPTSTSVPPAQPTAAPTQAQPTAAPTQAPPTVAPTQPPAPTATEEVIISNPIATPPTAVPTP